MEPAVARELIEQIAKFKQPRVEFFCSEVSEGVFELVERAAKKEIKVAARFSTTASLTEANLKKFKAAGGRQAVVLLDSPEAVSNDKLRGEEGYFKAVVEAGKITGEIDLPLKVVSVLSSNNQHLLAELMLMVDVLNPEIWQPFFLVPEVTESELRLPNTYEIRQLFLQLYELTKEVDFKVEVAEAPTYRRYSIERFLWQQGINPGEKFKRGALLKPTDILKKLPGDHSLNSEDWGVNSGRGLIYINSCGEVYPDRFLPVKCGDLGEKSLSEIYREAPLMKKLKTPGAFKTKCVKNGCWARFICGGSRARGYHYTGDPLGTDPLCFYAALE